MIKIFVTGGTFDKDYDEKNGKLYFKDTHMSEILNLGRSKVEVNIETLMMIDSLDMKETDRRLIVDSCETTNEKNIRSKAIQDATHYAIEVPFKVMETSMETYPIIKAMSKIGNPNSVTDAGVGALCVRAAVHGAFLNVKINTSGLKDKKYVTTVLKKGKIMIQKADKLEKEILKIVNSKI